MKPRSHKFQQGPESPVDCAFDIEPFEGNWYVMLDVKNKTTTEVTKCALRFADSAEATGFLTQLALAAREGIETIEWFKRTWLREVAGYIPPPQSDFDEDKSP